MSTEPGTQQRIAGCHAKAAGFFAAASRAFSIASANRKSNPDEAAKARGIARNFIKMAEAAEEQAAALANTA